MIIEGDAIIFDSGRRVESACNCGVIGLSPSLESISEGWDGGICSLAVDEFWDDEPPKYTPKEKIEICDYMITLWEKAKKIIIINK